MEGIALLMNMCFIHTKRNYKRKNHALRIWFEGVKEWSECDGTLKVNHR